jgi:hypothetical protein
VLPGCFQFSRTRDASTRLSSKTNLSVEGVSQSG